MLTKQEISGRLNSYKTDLKKQYHVQRLRFFNLHDDELTLVVSFDTLLNTNESLHRKELEHWLSSILQCNAHVLLEQYVRYFIKRSDEDLILN